MGRTWPHPEVDQRQPRGVRTVKSEYHAGMDAGEALIICEVERLAMAAETVHEKNILYSLLNHLTLAFPEEEEV